MPECLPEQSELIGNRSGAARADSSSHGRMLGHWSADSSTPARARMPRTAATCTGSALWDAHMTETSASVKSNGARDSETVACSGFIDDRAKTTRSASPAVATGRLSAFTTATSTRWTDSSSPLRTTRTTPSPGMERAQTSLGIWEGSSR